MANFPPTGQKPSRRFFRGADQRQQLRSRRVAADPLTYLVDQPAQSRQVRDGQESLLTIRQARDYLNVSSIWAVYRLIRFHALPVRRLGRSLRFDQSELEQWTRRQRQDQGQRLVVVLPKGA